MTAILRFFLQREYAQYLKAFKGRVANNRRIAIVAGNQLFQN